MRSRRFLGLAALAAVLILSGCRLTANVTITMNADGSGVVAVDLVADADLLAKAPAAVSDLRLDDARQAGWEVTGPAPTPDGGSSIRLDRESRRPTSSLPTNSEFCALATIEHPRPGASQGGSRRP